MSIVKAAAFNHPSASSGGLAISSTGNVSGAGLDLIVAQTFSAASSVSVDNCFTSAYENYRVLADFSASATSFLNVRVRAASSDATGSIYRWGRMGLSNTNPDNGASNPASSMAIGYSSSGTAILSFDIYSPAVATQTFLDGWNNRNASDVVTALVSGVVTDSNSYDGFSVYPDSGTITGTLRVYGYRN